MYYVCILYCLPFSHCFSSFNFRRVFVCFMSHFEDRSSSSSTKSNEVFDNVSGKGIYYYGEESLRLCIQIRTVSDNSVFSKSDTDIPLDVNQEKSLSNHDFQQYIRNSIIFYSKSSQILGGTYQ